jgi:hypothetical protein
MFLQDSTSPVNGTAVRDAEKGNRTRKKSLRLVELLVSYGLILTANWTSSPAQPWFYWAAVAWICGSTAAVFIRSRSIELRMTGFWRSLWIVGTALMLAALTIAIAAKMHTLQQPYGPMGRAEAFVGYAVWAIAQQWLLQGYFLPRLAQVTPRESWAAAIVGGLFAVAHLPNAILTVMALFWGLTASFLFLRYRSIATLGFAHAVLGITVAISIPGPVLHNMRVGLAYLRYQTPVELRPVRADYRASNATWNGNRVAPQKLRPIQKLQMDNSIHTEKETEPIEVTVQ